jgi:hypothetical protein
MAKHGIRVLGLALGLALALVPSLAGAEAGEYGGTDAMDQTMGHATGAAAADTVTASPAAVSRAAAVYEGDEVVVTGRAANLLGRADSGSSGSVDQQDLGHRALLRPAEVLEAVPGLLVTQHSGDGKANQYFTRGFNLDHGTDFAFSMDGVPVNEQSNAHGQGYADLNFMIPELVTEVSYAKGPVNVEAGDFNTAGSADFSYPTTLKTSIASLTLGDFGYERALAASQFTLLGGNIIYALEFSAYDGPWTTPEANKKYNGFLRYSRGPADDRWVISASALEASWNATNQVPQGAIADGLINEFGAIDPSDGGDRRRDAVWTSWAGKTDGREADLLGYVIVSHMQLWNDFTYDLTGNGGQPVGEPTCTDCDQFEQFDERTRTGGTARYKFPLSLGGLGTKNEVGLDARNDNITALDLYDTVARVRWRTVSANQVIETSGAPYVKNTIQWTPWLKTELGFRQDFFHFNVIGTDPNLPGQSAVADASLPSPKAAISLWPGEGPLEVYLNYDWGFHSNDARSLTPNSIQQAGAAPVLAQAKGEELGFRYAQGERYESTLALWYLDMSSEITFDGDAAQASINNASYRKGVEWSNTYRAKPFFVDLDLALSNARFFQLDTVDDPNHPGYAVPEAIAQVGTLTLGVDKVAGWSADARVRYFGARNLTADGAENSSPDTLVSLHLGRELVGGQVLNVDIFNLLDADSADVSYYYQYQLAGQASPREDVMSHATEPRSLRVSWVDRF